MNNYCQYGEKTICALLLLWPIFSAVVSADEGSACPEGFTGIIPIVGIVTVTKGDAGTSAQKYLFNRGVFMMQLVPGNYN